MMAKAAASHEYEDHTSEVAIRLLAPTLGDLFGEAARALMEVMGGPDPVPPGAPPATEIVTVESSDREALLVDWLNELIFRVETERRLFCDFEIQAISDRRLRAAVHGGPVGELRTAVKAASFHGLKISESERGFAATVVLDV